jgi:hypothetical protein
MIYSEIQNYVRQAAGGEVVDLFDRAQAVLERINFEDYLDVLENAIGDFSDQGDTAVVDVMRLRLREMFDSLLAMHGIKLVEDVPLSDRIDLVDAICAISDCDEYHSLLLALETQESPQEIFATLISLVSMLKIEDVLLMIEDVSDELVARMREVILQPSHEQLEEVEVVEERITAYQKYRIVFANDVRWTERFVEFTEAVGLPFNSYAKLYMAEQFNRDINESTDTQMAWRRVCVNLIGIACLCEEGIVKAAELAKPYLEHISSDLSALTQIYAKLTNLLQEYNRAQT